jgi:hypothetical protein
MIISNYRARIRTKEHCLTFGDVVVASVLDPELKIKNECLLNSGDGLRSVVAHMCHKHCKDLQPSPTGDSIGHCQKCKRFNEINKAADLPHPRVAIKYKRSLLSSLGSIASAQMLILTFTSLVMLAVSIMLLFGMMINRHAFKEACSQDATSSDISPSFGGMISHIIAASYCKEGVAHYLKRAYGTWGGFNSSAPFVALPADKLASEFLAFAISNGAQFLYSLLYLLLIYNISLISMEHEWGAWEIKRKKPRCTIVSGKPFEQSYFLQLPPKLLLPLMGYAALMHWLLGQAISTIETIYADPERGIERSIYTVSANVSEMQTLTEHLILTGQLCCISNLHVHSPYRQHDRCLLVGVHLQERRVHSSNVSFFMNVMHHTETNLLPCQCDILTFAS